ncbi:MAG: endonuclease domain-containing protein [Crocinitomicaceae bacterium]|nr:endonuclease domain-containing protein [Crocinitomicaceae bacterium]
MAKQEMFKGASSIIFKRAERLRDRMTEAECLLWEELRNKKFPVKFRRQHPLGKYIADFYCHKLKLVIELDGNIHLKPEVNACDKIREDVIRSFGLTVIRFTNEEVITTWRLCFQKLVRW